MSARATNLWPDADHARAYLDVRDSLPQRDAGMRALGEWVPAGARRILDLGTGDGVLIEALLDDRPEASGVAVDFSDHMLDAARERLAGRQVEIVRHDLATPLPDLGTFDAVVSSFAIHHVGDERKRALYAEVFDALEPSGIFCNLEHVSSPTERLHVGFLAEMGVDPEDDDPSNLLLDVETQLRWLREIGFEDVDCHWKWRELALLAGIRPGR